MGSTPVRIHIAAALAVVFVITPFFVSGQSMGGNSGSGGSERGSVQGNKTARQRCNNNYIFEKSDNPDNQPKGKLPYEIDEYNKFKKEYTDTYRAGSEKDADAYAATRVQRGIKSGKICDGQTVCGSMFYQDDAGNDKIVCANQCDKTKCNQALAELTNRIFEAAGAVAGSEATAVGVGKDAISEAAREGLPSWAYKNLQNAGSATDLVYRFYSDGTGEFAGIDYVPYTERAAPRDYPSGMSVGSYSDIGEYTQDKLQGDTEAPSAPDDPPPLRIQPGTVPGVPLQPVKPTDDGYTPPLSNYSAPNGTNVAQSGFEQKDAQNNSGSSGGSNFSQFIQTAEHFFVDPFINLWHSITT